MRPLILSLIFALHSCSSVQENAATQNSNSSPSTNSNSQNNISAAKAKRIALLESARTLNAGAEAELAVLKRGGTQREAQLTAKLFQRGLTDREASEKKYLEQNKGERESFLLAKKEFNRLNAAESLELMRIINGEIKDVESTPSGDDTLYDKAVH